jgi:hypothetical protein
MMPLPLRCLAGRYQGVVGDGFEARLWPIHRYPPQSKRRREQLPLDELFRERPSHPPQRWTKGNGEIGWIDTTPEYSASMTTASHAAACALAGCYYRRTGACRHTVPAQSPVAPNRWTEISFRCDTAR